jgi:hypothetical protein
MLMKRFTLATFFFFILAVGQVWAQALVLSKVKVETEVNGILQSNIREIAEIELNPQTLDFTSNLSILPTLIGNTDSSGTSPNLYCVTIKAKFPIGNLDFATEEYEDKNYTMSALVTINDRSKQYMLPFQLFRPTGNRYNYNIDVSSLNYYPGYISFRLGINPDDFNMDPANMVTKKKIVIEIPEGIINKNQDALNVARCKD